MSRPGTVVILMLFLLISSGAVAQSDSRIGVVHLDNRAFADSDGAFPALGASLFWAVWGYKHDRARLEANLAVLERHEVDFIRCFAQVGPTYWEDRTVDPGWQDYAEALGGTIDLAFEHGLRTELTIFAGTELTPTPETRRAFVERVIEVLKPRAEKLIFIEVANEYYHESIFGDGREGEIRELAALLMARLPNLVTLSAPPSDEDGCLLYSGSEAPLGSAHFSRDVRGDLGAWGPVFRPLMYPGKCFPRVGVNNEPIGPGSSVASEDDPARLVAAAMVTYLAGLPAYVYHSHAGIWGGGQRSHGEANLLDHPTAAETLRGFKAMRALLPPDLANWERCAPEDPRLPMGAVGDSVQAAAVACKDGKFIALAVARNGEVRLMARTPVKLKAFVLPALEMSKDAALSVGDGLVLDGKASLVMLEQ